MVERAGALKIGGRPARPLGGDSAGSAGAAERAQSSCSLRLARFATVRSCGLTTISAGQRRSKPPGCGSRTMRGENWASYRAGDEQGRLEFIMPKHAASPEGPG